MLSTCEQLAAGLGAASVKEDKGKNKGGVGVDVDAVGNAPLRLWVGERFLGRFPLPSLVFGTLMRFFWGGIQSFINGGAKSLGRKNRPVRIGNLPRL
jgi:hypothetical protein